MLIRFILTCILLSTLWTRLGAWIREYFVKTTLGLYEVDEIGRQRIGGKIKGVAVIAGGSIGGLWAARFAAAHFEEVVVVEPEGWTSEEEGIAPRWDETGKSIASEPEPKRSRVFQYLGTHTFQAIHALVFSRAFPNFEAEALKDNIQLVNSFIPIAYEGIMTSPPTEYYMHTKMPRTISASRPGYERLLRRLVRHNYANIRWVKGTVTGVVPSDDRQHIRAVVIDLAEEEKTVQQEATLLVDASGGAAAGLKWLRDQSYGQKTHTPTDLTFDNFRISYEPKMRYRCYEWNVPTAIQHRLPSVLEYEDSAAIYVFHPDAAIENRDVGIVRREGNRVQVILGGWDVAFSDLPTTPAEFTKCLKSIRAQKPVEEWVYTFFQMINDANDMGLEDKLQYLDYRAPTPTHLQYHRIVDLPCNFVALGDAVMKVNPIYGQGCAKALMGALALHSLLLQTTVHRHDKDADTLSTDFSRKFFALQAPKIEAIWDNTKVPDYSWSTTTPVEGETNSTGWFVRAYVKKLMEVRYYDRDIEHTWFLKIQFLTPGIRFFAPRIVLKVLWYTLTSPFYQWKMEEKYKLEVRSR